MAKALQKCLLFRFPFIKVLLKPIDTNIIKDNEATLKLLNSKKIIDDKYKDVRIGAFEVQLCIRQNENNKVLMLHSKLGTKQWPNIKQLLEKIVFNLPQVKIQIQCYDKDRESENQFKNKTKNLKQSEDEFKSSRYEKIKVNIYRLKIPQINELNRIQKEGIIFL